MTTPILPPTPSASDYTEAKLNYPDIFAQSDPFVLFAQWMEEAGQTEVNDPHAMSLATVDSSGMPDVRIVLLKDFDARGFVFYTNAASAKGEQLQDNGQAALCFHWKTLRRQIRIRGTAKPVSAVESDTYFQSRARGSRIGAIASDQSAELESRVVLEDRITHLTQDYKGRDIPRPVHWHGWRVAPRKIEFWRNRPYRLHDRLQFSAVQDGWTRRRLYP